MNIEFTPEEYANLIRLVHLGEWMANSNHDDLTETEQKFVALKSKLLSHAKEADLESWADYRKGDDEWEESIDFLELMEEEGWIDDYNTIVTQDEIIATAAESELIAQVGHEAFNNMSMEEIEERLTSIRADIVAEMERLSNPDNLSKDLPDDPSILPFPEGN